MGGLLDFLVVVGALGAFFLPVCDLVDGGVAACPSLEGLGDGWGELGEWDGGLVAMDATKAVVADVAGEVGEEGGAAAFGDGVAERDVDEPLLPEGALVGGLGGEAERGDERMGHPPCLAVELPEGLGAPAGEGDVVEGTEGATVLAPDAIGWGLGMFVGLGHGGKVAGRDGRGLAWNSGARPLHAGDVSRAWAGLGCGVRSRGWVRVWVMPVDEGSNEGVWAAKWPFVMGDLLLLGAGGWVAWAMHEGRLEWGLGTASLVVGAVAVGAWVLATPFLRDHEAATRRLEQEGLADTLRQVRQLEEAATGIAAGAGNIRSGQQALEQARVAVEQVAARLAEERKAVLELQARAMDQERQTTRLELEKLRRGEEETVRVLCHLLDHNYAVYQAGQRSGQAALAQQLGQYRGACLDAVRRLGLAAHEASPGEAFDPARHEVAEGGRPGAGAVVRGTVACGYTFRGAGIRPIIVSVEDPGEAARPEAGSGQDS